MRSYWVADISCIDDVVNEMAAVHVGLMHIKRQKL